jgi:general stress protein YciG
MAKRGFAAMDRERVRAIARTGGKAAHAAGTAHRFTTSEAQAAGRKGGLAKHTSRGRQISTPLKSGDAPLSSGGTTEVYIDDEGPETQRAPIVTEVA